MHHGEKNFEVTAPRSKFYQGGFGRLFPELEPWAPDHVPQTGGISNSVLEEHFMAFVATHMTESADLPGGDSRLPAGYTYFGQFVDHDITHDVTPLSEADVDPDRLHNFRTPRLDLDSLYGAGQKDQPYLYQPGTGKFKSGNVEAFVAGGPHTPTQFKDLPRDGGAALIGDPRNDENIIVAQIHLAFLLAHNKLVDAATVLGHAKPFESARKTLRWLYQWIVWHDYVKRICRGDVHRHALDKKKGNTGGISIWEAGYKDIYDWKNSPFMPVEFSAAAYRFGHSLIRGGYLLNGRSPRLPTFTTGAPAPDGAPTDLRGGGALFAARVIQWDRFLKMGATDPVVARKFDPVLVPALSALPDVLLPAGAKPALLNVLAARNLLRGVSLKLPSAQSVAKFLGIEYKDPALPDGEALWYYILHEANAEGGETLGEMGSIIVAATFAGLLKGDPISFFNLEPKWEPGDDPLLRHIFPELQQDVSRAAFVWELATVIRLSGLPVTQDDYDSQLPAPAAGQ